ncbi:uncharacterized protein BO72DRAFT_494378 [Aspergillus fijiensis CBS 313.89]|uniref:Uncharacterized protein n=1 Tax=Aspergillus fijiensis CBS 313.89 TaxID=1448319 RepID=A0A8G1RVK2_9EURO|nr:uncharacterized protein BO72DRAFT_494378 [Aspergillus fijiensis CBS 313.89]RAK79527.1 hypothetical protein BO72DRAFT_494378 [Aspergillus fijiensis CBS 313.89]
MPDTWARLAGVVGSGRRTGRWYPSALLYQTLINGYGYLPHGKPLSGRPVEDGDDDNDDSDLFWGAAYTAPEATSDERDVAQSILDPALLEVYEALIRDSSSSDNLFLRVGP